MPRQPGTTMVPAVSSASSPASAWTWMPPMARSFPGSAAQTVKRYQSANSGRGSPNTSTATPNSKVHSPS